MPRILRLVFLLYFVIFLFWLFACRKESDAPTIIVGEVIDAKSGLPVEKATMECGAYKGEIGHEIFKDFTTSSNAQGQYEIIIPNDYNRVSLFRSYRAGYLTKIDPAGIVPLSIGDSNTVDIEMIPTDGFFRLKINNIISQNDTIYVQLLSPTTWSEGLGSEALNNYPLILSEGNTHIELFQFPSEESIDIYWDFKQFTIPAAQFKNSIFLSPSDTTDFIIDY